jgi:hypothetical protein
LRTSAPAAGLSGRGAVTEALAFASATAGDADGSAGDAPLLHAAAPAAITIAAPNRNERFMDVSFKITSSFKI